MHIIDEREFKRMQFHVFDADNEPRACFYHVVDALALVAFLGNDATITDPNCTILWNEGHECQHGAKTGIKLYAADSWDECAAIIEKRLERFRVKL